MYLSPWHLGHSSSKVQLGWLPLTSGYSLQRRMPRLALCLLGRRRALIHLR
jgi:hypothetical protein